VRHFALPHSLENIMGTARFDTRGVTLDGLTGRLGDGPVQFFGRIDKEGFLPARLDVQMTGQGMTLRFPEGMRSKVDATLFLQGTPQGATLSGDVYVRDALYTRTFETDILNLVGSAVTTANASGGGGTLQQPVPLRYDVRITAPQSLRIDNNVLRLVASADLQLRGTFERPTLLGNTEINRGDMLFEGRRYIVTRGAIDFNNPNRIEPFFDVEAQTRVRVPGDTYIVSLRAVGTPSRVTFDLSADPPLPELEILALLFSDVDPGRNVELRRYSTEVSPQQQLLRDRASRALTQTVSSEVGRVVQQTFGVDTFQITPSLIDPNSQAARLEPGARLTIGQRLSDRVYLTYSRSQTASTRNQIILLEYDQTDRLSWVFSRNEDRTYAVDVRVRHVF